MSKTNFDEVIDKVDTSVDNLQIGLPSFEAKTNNRNNKKVSLIEIENRKARLALEKELDDLDL